MILFKKIKLNFKKFFTHSLTKKLILPRYSEFETVQLLSKTFFAMDNNNEVNQDDGNCILSIYWIHQNDKK